MENSIVGGRLFWKEQSMEFSEKLQQLRKQKGLTQEALAQMLYVSRTAVSKWESGRGYPNIESLKAIAAFFSVTVDALLSCDEMLTIAEEDRKQSQIRSCDLVFGLLDCGGALFFFLPFFGQTVGSVIQSVSLLSLTQAQPYMKAAYFALVIGLILWGILTLALQSCQKAFWMNCKRKVSVILNGAAAFLFIISQQPYGAAFLLLFLTIKVLMLTKKQ